MALKTIDLGTSPNKGDGDPLRTAFTKINDNFTEVYALLGAGEVDTDDVIAPMLVHNNHTNVTVTRDDDADQIIFSVDQAVTDLQGSVFGDDSTLLVDGVNSSIPKANIEDSTNWDSAFAWGNHAAAGYADGTNEANWDTAFSWGDHSAAGYQSASGTFTGDVKGSMFADDSTLLVDGVNGTIPAANLTGTLPALDGSALTGVTASSIAFADVTATPTTLAGYGITDAVTAGGDFEGNLNGSVFADDSTLLVDGVNGTIPAANLTGVLPALDASNLINIPAGTASSLDGDMKGSVFADDSTLLVDGVNGTVNISNQNLDALSDVSYDPVTLVGPPTVNGQPLVWDTVEQKWYPGFATTVNTLTANTRVQLNGNGSEIEWVDDTSNGGVQPYFRTKVRFTGTLAQDETITFPAETGTVLLNTTVNTSIDGHLNTTGAGTNEVLSWNGADYVWVAQSGGSGGTGDLVGSVFADDSTLLVDGVGGTIAGPISSQTWMAAYDGYVTIANGGATGPGPIQIVASANLDLTSGNNNDINITPHGSGRVKVSDGGLGIVEAATFIGHADETMYLSSKTNTTESTHITLNSTSGVQTTLFGAVDFVSGGSVDFTGSTVTGLSISGLQPEDETTASTQGTTLELSGGDSTGLNSDGGDLTLVGGNGSSGTHGDISIGATQTGSITIGAGSVGTSIGGTLTVNGNAFFDTGVQEAFGTLTGSTGVTAMDCDNGQVFYLTGATGDITANFTNLGLTAEYGTNVTVIINQGVTPYEVTAVQIGGVAQTINWQGGTPPTGNASGIDSFSFTILNDGGTYVVLGQMVDFT